MKKTKETPHREEHAEFPRDRMPSIRRVMMPRDTNAFGTIFGGVILAEIDLAAAVEAHQHHSGRLVTVAMDAVVFKAPVLTIFAPNWRRAFLSTSAKRTCSSTVCFVSPVASRLTTPGTSVFTKAVA